MVSGEEVVAIFDPEPEVQNVRMGPAIRAALEELDDLNLRDGFTRSVAILGHWVARVCVKGPTPPRP